MKKVYVPLGGKVNFPETFENLQNDVHENLQLTIDKFVESYGVVADTSADAALSVTNGDDLTIYFTAGEALTESGHYIKVLENVAYTLPDTGEHELYIKYSGTDAAPLIEVSNAFLYGAIGNYAYSQQVANYAFVIDVDPGISGLHLATVDASGDTITDQRTFLKLKTDALGADVVKTDRDTVVDGTITVDTLGVAGDYTLYINPSGLDQDYTINASGVNYAYTYAHNHADDTFVPSDVTIAASEVNSLFRQGSVNFQDGNGYQLIKTEKIPSIPNIVTSFGGQTIQVQPSSSVKGTLQDTLVNYRADEIAYGRAGAAYGQIGQLRGYIQDYVINNPTTTNWQELWNDDTVVDAGGHTISGLARNMVNYGWATSEQLSLAVPSGQSAESWTISDVLNHQGTTLANKYVEKDDAYASLQANATKIANESERIKADYSVVRAKFRHNITWSEPTLVDNEAITSYDLRIYQVADSNWSGNEPTEAQMNLNANKELTKKVNDYESLKAKKKLTLKETFTFSEDWVAGTRTAYFDAGSFSNLALNDYAVVSGLESEKNRVLSWDSGEGTITFALPATSGADNDDYLQTYRQEIVSSDSERSFWIDVNRDEHYLVYVRPNTELGIVGDWSAGHYIKTNDLTIGGNLLSDLTSVDDDVYRSSKEAEVAALKRDVQDAVAQLQFRLDVMPTMQHIQDLTDVLVSGINYGW